MQTMKDICINDRETPAGNSGFKKLAVQWLNEVQFFKQTFVQVDSFVLRNRQLLKPANRCAQCRWTDSVLRTLAHLLAAHSYATPKQAKEPTFSTRQKEVLKADG